MAIDEQTSDQRLIPLVDTRAAAGLIHYRARWYDADTGQFVSEDPAFVDKANTERPTRWLDRLVTPGCFEKFTKLV